MFEPSGGTWASHKDFKKMQALLSSEALQPQACDDKSYISGAEVAPQKVGSSLLLGPQPEAPLFPYNSIDWTTGCCFKQPSQLRTYKYSINKSSVKKIYPRRQPKLSSNLCSILIQYPLIVIAPNCFHTTFIHKYYIKTSSSKARGRCYTIYCLLSTVDVYCLLPTAYCLLPTAYCPLSTVYCLLSTVYC